MIVLQPTLAHVDIKMLKPSHLWFRSSCAAPCWQPADSSHHWTDGDDYPPNSHSLLSLSSAQDGEEDQGQRSKWHPGAWISHNALQHDGWRKGTPAQETVAKPLGQHSIEEPMWHVEIYTQMQLCQYDTENNLLGQKATRQAVCLLSQVAAPWILWVKVGKVNVVRGQDHRMGSDPTFPFKMLFSILALVMNLGSFDKQRDMQHV